MKFDLWQWCDILISTDDIMYGKCWPIYLGFMPCVLLSVWSCVECLWLEKQWSSDLYTLSLIASECTCSTSRWLNWRKCHYLVVTSLSETIFHFLSAFSLFKKVLIFMQFKWFNYICIDKSSSHLKIDFENHNL